jgi:hypothetical protein
MSVSTLQGGIFTMTLIASSTRSRAYQSVVGKSSMANVWVWILAASKRFSAMQAWAVRSTAAEPSPPSLVSVANVPFGA